MHTIQIFKHEIDDGIAEKVQSTASIAYCAPFSIKEGKAETKSDIGSIEKLLAENKDQNDLYYLESVLVSTNWNRNDDVFLSDVTWSARNTPEDKQFNFMHDENDIIGHITGSYVINKDGQVIADDSEQTPKDFDIITTAVLYNSWMNEENRERMQRIIAEIDEDKWFVSMECLFAGFDYAVINKTGNQQLITRSEASSFLTKHLRAYGGTGEYEGYKVGRALRDISFSGKGLVSNPANPRSIILNSKSIAFSVSEISTIEEINMSKSQVQDEQVVEKPVVAQELAEEVVGTVEADAVDTESGAEDVAEATEEVTDKVEVTAEEETVETADYDDDENHDKKKKQKQEEEDESKAALEEVLKSFKAKIAALEAIVAKSAKDLQEAEAAMYDMKKSQKEDKRKAALIEAGVSTDEVDDTFASFDALDDEAFNAVVSLYARKSVVADSEDVLEATQESDETEAAEIFDEVETSEATLVEAETEEADEAMLVRASIASYIEKSILTK